MSHPADLEPAERDPKKLRRTAWVLVAVMVLGGVLILAAYQKVAEDKAKDTRPAHVYQITRERSLRVIRQDGSQADLFDLRGGVFVIHTLSLKHPESGKLSLEVMKRLAAKHAATPGFNLVSLAVEPLPSGETAATLAAAAKSHGMILPQWWLGTNEPATLHKFIKNELKTNIFPHEENGRWVFDTSIILIDKQGRIRRAVVPQQRGGPPYVADFDFDEAAGFDARGVKTGNDRTNVRQLEFLLETTIDTLLAEPAESP